MDFPPRLEQPPKVKFYARVSSRVPFLYLKINNEPNLAFLSGRLTSSSDLVQSRSFSVQRLFFHHDVIVVTSWASDVVNLVRPIVNQRGVALVVVWLLCSSLHTKLYVTYHVDEYHVFPSPFCLDTCLAGDNYAHA